MESAFSEKRILDVLSRMAAHQQLTFGAACCERMLPNYEIFVREVGWRDAGPLRNALAAAWAACDSEGPSDREFGQIPTRLRGASGSGASAIVSLDLGDLPRDAVQKVLDRIFRS